VIEDSMAASEKKEGGVGDLNVSSFHSRAL